MHEHFACLSRPMQSVFHELGHGSGGEEIHVCIVVAFVVLLVVIVVLVQQATAAAKQR